MFFCWGRSQPTGHGAGVLNTDSNGARPPQTSVAPPHRRFQNPPPPPRPHPRTQVVCRRTTARATKPRPYAQRAAPVLLSISRPPHGGARARMSCLPDARCPSHPHRRAPMWMPHGTCFGTRRECPSPAWPGGNAYPAARTLGKYHGTWETVPFVNGTSERVVWSSQQFCPFRVLCRAVVPV